MQFWLFPPFLGQFQHVGYQNACTRAEKFIGNTFKKFHARVHAISRNFTQFSRNLGYFSHLWANFNMLGIEMHVLQLRNSMLILSCTPLFNFMQFSHNFTQFWLLQPFWANFNIFGIQVHVLELINSMVIFSHTFMHSLTKFQAIFTQFQLFQPRKGAEGPPAAPCKG